MKHIRRLTIVLFSLALSCAAQVKGSGTPGGIPLWTGSTTPSTTLGNSVIFQAGGKVGIGSSTPAATLTIIGQKGTSTVPNAPTALQVTAGNGASSRVNPGGAGGGIALTSGNGGADLNGGGGAGGMILITGGGGGFCQFVGSGCAFFGGNGGSILLQPGLGGFAPSPIDSGHSGNVLLVPTSGNVGIGETSPSNTLEVKIGGTTLADHWTTRSSRRFKTNIQPLEGALEKVERLQGVSYERKSDGKHEIGVVAEDVAEVVPELVSRDPETKEIQGVDYSRLAALLIEAVKMQQAEIQQLKTRVQELTTKPRD